MGFLSNLLDAFSRPRLRDPVRGVAQVISASMPPYRSGGGGMCEMNLVITIPGQPSVAVTKASLVRLAQWPLPGMLLPVLAERSDARTYAIQWAEVPSGAQRAAEQARRVAEQANAGDSAPAAAAAASAGPAARSFTRRSQVTINGQPATPEALAAVELMTGMDLDGDGRIGGREAAPAPHDGADATPSVESRLRQLQALHDGGLIGEDEYRAKRAQILSSL
ncbi:SHOCT domain-containing protein [Dokdonella sp.]|uniref:SHOCT domain-containing protein n=1 Tax=Dokdonella sp. TaxID=2291710 RepID=UPI0027BACB60|nr:SHOCT domain-containing protein [Dokdonella sp.]